MLFGDGTIFTKMYRLLVFSTLLAFGLGASIHTLPEVDEGFGGIFPNGKIIGGEEIDISKVPYTLALEFGNRQICGAVILAPKVAITAAHCIRNLAPCCLQVRAATNRLLMDGDLYQVDDVITHPAYNEVSRHDSDVALLLLEKPIAIGPKSKPIPIVEKEPISGNVIVTGWGDREEGSGTGSQKLRGVSVPIVRRADCVKAYANIANITATMICAGAPEKDSCHGDSGGPAAIGGKLAGVVSFGNGCGLLGYPGVYVNVAHPSIRNWIRENGKV